MPSWMQLKWSAPCQECSISISAGEYAWWHHKNDIVHGAICRNCQQAPYLFSSALTHFVAKPGEGADALSEGELVQLTFQEERCVQCEGRILKRSWCTRLSGNTFICEYCKPFYSGPDDPGRPF